MPEPKIYTKNYAAGESEFTSSHGDDFLEYLVDRDNDSQYVSNGANSDSTSLILDCTFMEAGEEREWDIDRIILVNHNLENPVFEYWDGAAWQALVSGVALVDSTSIFTFNQVTTSKVRLTVDDTQTPNQEKMIGEFIVTKLGVSLPDEYISYGVGSRQMSTEITLSDGSMHKTYIKPSVNRTEKYETKLSFTYLTRAQMDQLKAIKEAGQSFLWQPQSISQPQDIWLVHWVGSFAWKFVSTNTGAGHTLELDFKEV